MELRESNALLVIEEMISKTRQDIQLKSFYFLLWGWLAFIAAISNYYLLVFTDVTYHSAPWLLMPVAGIITGIRNMLEKRKPAYVQTYVSDLLKHVIWAFAFSMFVVCFLMPAGNQWAAFYPTIMIIYAIWMYVSGSLLKFKPLVAGAILNWILAGVGFIWQDTAVHLLLISAALLGGYIIPGHLMNLKKAENVQ